MEKAYEKIVFVNDQAPDLDADNLNSISDAIDTIDDRVVEQDALIDGLDTRVSTNTTNISTNTADIADLKSNTGFEISSASPLNGCSASSIVGIDVDGCSTQATVIATVQGQVANTSSAINQTLTDSTIRCSSDVLALNSGTVLSVASGFEIYALYSETASGNITTKVGWAQSVTLTANGYWRMMVRKTSNYSLTPSDFVLQNTPTPTNPISIVDASGDVTCRTEDNTQSNTITLPTLRSVGTVKDELIVNGDGGSKTVSVGEYTFDGTEEFTYTANWGGLHAFTWKGLANRIKSIASNDVYGGLMHPNFYVSTRNITSVSAKEGMMAQNTINDVFFCTNQYSNPSDFVDAIKGTTLRYALATPTTTTLTASEVSAIRQLQTYSGTTIVDSALDVKSVTYHAGVKEYIDWRFEQLATLMLGEE